MPDLADPPAEGTDTFPRIPQPGSAWEHGVDARLGALEATAMRTEAKVDDIVPKLVEELTKPPLVERCGKWVLDFATLVVTRLTTPEAIRYTALVLIVAGVLFAGATFTGLGVSIIASP